ncbi:hypothetical protein CAPTEDRAFT_187823 [Capitella teleta]|uniref:Mab-21-like nucleotidyltransferase domain-containing protein n=1 Tax=Capitella teleta TaxID=283909 RepID=R7VAK0_CAPTE|nr:hypothetical protein CAPTEDRAFT_187823 [Capitella teleta]|eukprot:ELU13366.1 hypothetical protein CAPTEDRAFT_187823 [Capitella teleta]
MNYDDFTEELMKQNANEILAIYASLLKSPVLGTRKCQEQCFQEETRLIEDEVMRLIKRFSERHALQYPRWAFEPKLRGSMEEGTKCGPPDEFDFLLIMNDLSENCQVNSIDNCKAYTAIWDNIDIGDVLKLPPNEMIDALHNVLLLRYSFASDGNPQPPNLDVWLVLTMKEYLMTHATWEGSRMRFVSCDRTNVGLCLNLIFNGHLYKMLHISIDLVPCIRLKMPGPVKVSIDWPFPVDFSQCQLYGLFRTGCDGFDISSTEYEEVLLKSLPTAAIDAYVLGKAFSSAQFKWSGNFGKIFQSSYKMKKALLMSVQLHQNAHAISLHEWIRGMISVAADRNKYAKKSDCLRCIFHAENNSKYQSSMYQCLRCLTTVIFIF